MKTHQGSQRNVWHVSVATVVNVEDVGTYCVDGRWLASYIFQFDHVSIINVRKTYSRHHTHFHIVFEALFKGL